MLHKAAWLQKCGSNIVNGYMATKNCNTNCRVELGGIPVIPFIDGIEAVLVWRYWLIYNTKVPPVLLITYFCGLEVARKG